MPADSPSSDRTPETSAAVSSFLSRARVALDSRSPPEDESLADLFADGCATALLLEAERRQLAHRAARLAAADADLAALRALHAQMAAISESLAGLRALLAELSERLPPRFSRARP